MSAPRPRDRPAVFLDRDGVLVRARVENNRPYAVRDVGDVELEEGAEDACQILHEAGFALVVVTNQPEIARGTITREAVEEINDAMRATLPIDEIVVCPHDDADGCACRKPRPGMLLDAAERLGLDLAASVMVGDRWRDVGAARAAGCRSVFLEKHYSERVATGQSASVHSLAEAVHWIMRQQSTV